MAFSAISRCVLRNRNHNLHPISADNDIAGILFARRIPEKMVGLPAVRKERSGPDRIPGEHNRFSSERNPIAHGGFNGSVISSK